VEIVVTRGETKQGATIGRMTVDGAAECFTLEGPVREVPGQPVSAWKVPNHTAIPRGRFEITITYSDHFECDLPLLLNVPGFTFVRIHWGNKAADTEGCILIGKTKDINLIYGSRDAFKALFPRIQAEIKAKRRVFVTVI
jgi:hypothetical protein